MSNNILCYVNGVFGAVCGVVVVVVVIKWINAGQINTEEWTTIYTLRLKTSARSLCPCELSNRVCVLLVNSVTSQEKIKLKLNTAFRVIRLTQSAWAADAPRHGCVVWVWWALRWCPHSPFPSSPMAPAMTWASCYYCTGESFAAAPASANGPIVL